MTSNPYQSPADIDVTERVGRRATLRLMGVGLFAGSIVGGTCGAAHGAVVAITAVLLRVVGFMPAADLTLESGLVFVLAAMIAGVLVGSPIGLVIGLLLGAIAGICGSQARRPLYVVGITIATFAAAIASGVVAISPAPTARAAFVLYAIMLLSGTLVGFLGGLCLVRGLAKLAWPPAANAPVP